MIHPTHTSRDGVLAAGTFVLDQVKTIDAWPDEDMLANIMSEVTSNGGGPYNVLKDLHALGASFPLEGVGLLGEDANAHWIRTDCATHNIDTAQLRSTNAAATSYTDAMCVAEDGRRTFFHQRGANSLFSPEHIDLASSSSKIFLLGYLLLLKAMDYVDANGRTGASRVLEEARTLGFTTAVETVSAPSREYRRVAIASLHQADLFFLNEVEVILHSARGAVCSEPDGALLSQPSLVLPPDWIAGSTGAGDAFTAGFVLGVHRGADTPTSLLQGVCSAAQSLTHPTASDGLVPMDECIALSGRFPFRDF